TLVLDEVEDLDDVRMLDLREEAPLRERGRGRVRVAGVEEALEHDPAVGHVVVLRQVDPAHAPVCEASDHLVLSSDESSRRKLRNEREGRAARAAEAGGSTRRPLKGATDRFTAVDAEAAILWNHRVSHQGLGWIAGGNRRDLHQP